MTIQECYDIIGGNYGDIVSRLRTEERIARFLIKVADDKSFDLLKTSLEEHNMEEAFRAAHTLKGICLNLSLTRLYESASKLTEILRGRKDYGDDITPLYEKVKADYELAVENINKLR